jgi:hypothetical protein
MKIIVAIAWIFAFLGALASFIAVIGGFLADNAIQQTNFFALALCCAVLPYCLARAVTEMSER